MNEPVATRAPAEVLLCFAMREEAAPFRGIAAGKSGASVLIVGVGPRNAEDSIRAHLAKGAPSLVLTCGLAGGLAPELALGDIVFDAASEELRARLVAAGAKAAKFFCSKRIVTTIAEKRRLRDETGAGAVEMESAAIHAVCRERAVPCVTVRVVSDTALEDLPLDFNTILKPDYSFDVAKLVWVIATSPRKIGALREFHRRSRDAAEKLALVLAQIVFPSFHGATPPRR